MVDGGIRIALADETLWLLPERAVWWPAAQTLVLADPHFGKPDAFRRAGLPVPTGVAKRDLDRLSGALKRTGSRRLVVLGDFYHARPDEADAAPAALRAWRAAHAELAITVIRGNHDVHAGPPAPDLGARPVAEGEPEGPFVWRHHPAADARGYVLAGHVHPCGGLGRSRFGAGRLPCFHVGAQCMVLPAFGSFTGMHPVRPRAGDRVYVVVEDAVLALPAA